MRNRSPRLRSELICNELGSKKLRNSQDLSSGHAHEECNRIHYVPEDKLECELVDSKSMADPCQ